MKRKLKSILIITTGSLLLVGCSTMHHGGKWEYKTVTNVSDTQLNQMAEEGWKVETLSVCAYPIGDPNKDFAFKNTYLLKRSKR